MGMTSHIRLVKIKNRRSNGLRLFLWLKNNDQNDSDNGCGFDLALKGIRDIVVVRQGKI